MALSSIKHPQKDFFILDISDVVPKGDTASMEHPFFSLATKPDMRELHYKSGENEITIRPSQLGLPTIKDKDVLIFCISQLMYRKNRGEEIGKHLHFSARELLIATERNTDGREYKRLENAISRLQGTQFITNIKINDNMRQTNIFSIIDSGGFVDKGEKRRLDHIQINLSDWLMDSIERGQVLTLHNDYFRIRSPLERRIYEICRKHCGKQPQWQISLDKLQNKTGSNAPERRFRYNLRKIIKEDETPDYRIYLNDYDLVTVTPRKTTKAVSNFIKEYHIPEDAEETARFIAREKGYDYHQLKFNWLTFANEQAASGKPIHNVGKAFIGFCKQKKNLR
jgi:plasmid replication initiation protein